jgi:hypothetical protein
MNRRIMLWGLLGLSVALKSGIGLHGAKAQPFRDHPFAQCWHRRIRDLAWRRLQR